MRSQFRQRLTFCLILFVFVMPMVAAYAMYRAYYKGAFQTTNRGVLIQPPLQIEKLPLGARSGKPTCIAELNGEIIRHRWILMYLTPALCEADCLATIHNMNQIYTALNKHNPHFLPLVVSSIPGERLTAVEPFVHYATVLASDRNDMLLKLPVSEQPNQLGRLYLIDPHGFLMMAYPVEGSAEDILKDCQHVIRG